MAYSAVGVPTSPVTSAKMVDITKTDNGLRRSQSCKDLCTRSVIRRSHSDNHLCCSMNRIQVTSVPPKVKSKGISPFQFSGSILPTSLRPLFDPETSIREKETHPKESMKSDDECDEDDDQDDNVCEVGYEEDDDDGHEVTHDRESFSKFLVQVPWSDTKLYSQLAFLQFITSSLEKKAEVAKLRVKLDNDLTRVPVGDSEASQDGSEKGRENEHKHQIQLAYDIAASAASYVQLRAKDLLSLAAKSKQNDNEDSNGREDSQKEEAEGGTSNSRVYKSEVAAYVAASTMTAVVAAGEREKQEAANDLQSLHSSPCEWFICDDSSNYTRCFVIQGSDSLASWQANLFFELVHRGIYEAAKGIYRQFMPEIMDHLKRYGDHAKLQFSGHSLGGSLSLLVHLMLLTNKVVNPSTLLPVVTFGSPFVFCGGQKLLDDLGLDESHIHSVMMHRDIVPRAFSCNYPGHVALILKRLNSSFRSHPCPQQSSCVSRKDASQNSKVTENSTR